MYDVLIKNRYAALNVDSFNRTAVCDEDVPNGSVFALKEYSEDADSNMVWKAEAVALMLRPCGWLLAPKLLSLFCLMALC